MTFSNVSSVLAGFEPTDLAFDSPCWTRVLRAGRLSGCRGGAACRNRCAPLDDSSRKGVTMQSPHCSHRPSRSATHSAAPSAAIAPTGNTAGAAPGMLHWRSLSCI